MTLREIVELYPEDDPLACLIGGLDIARSWVQQESATFEGCLASFRAWERHYGKPTHDAIRQWLADLGPFADKDIPDAMITIWVQLDD